MHVDPERGFSGGEVQVFLLLEGLRARGHEVLLACQPASAPAREAAARGIATLEVPMRGDLDLAAARALRRGMRAHAVELVHLHTGRANWLGGLAAWRAGVPAVSTRRMDRRVKRNWKTRLVYGKLVLRTAAISPAVLARLAQAGVPAVRTRLIWSSVDPARLAPTRPAAELRAELGAAPDDVVLLALGALVERKGFDLLLAAFAGLPARARLWIAGEGPERAALAARLGARARLLGQRTDVPDLLAACDVFVMPSRAEGLGVAALEAMAAGRAVVASRVGGLGEAVVHERTGLLVPPDDAPALAAALLALVEDADLRARYSAAGPGRVAEGFLAEQMVDAYEALYREVLEERP
jgi:glycosyltransferase involved in cell wall biosynthesis